MRQFDLWMVSSVLQAFALTGRRACDMRSQMDLQLTLMLTLAAVALAVVAGWRGARPPDPHKGPRLIPWRFIMLMTTAGIVVLLVHVVNLMGVTTGR